MDEELEHLLQRCAVCLNDRLERHELRPAYNREPEISAVLQLLASAGQLHPVLLGRPRSGKTVLAHEVARRIAQGAVPDGIGALAIYELTPASLLAGLQFGEGWRANLANLLQRIAETSGVLLFLRDAHTAVGSGVNRGDDDDDDLAAALETALRDTRIRLLAEARPDRWQVLAAQRETFAGLFAPLPLRSLLPDEVAEIVERTARHIHARDGVTVTPAAQAGVLDIAGRFILNQAFPGKAIELLEESVLLARRAGSPLVEASHVVACFSARTGLTPLLLDDAAPFREAEVRRTFSERVLGQEPAVQTMVQKLALLKARLQDPTRPMGVYLYLGPTGVGKTELARTLAAALFGSEERFVRFNMADFSGPQDFAQLFGISWGDSDVARRGRLTMALVNLPFAVLLLDEFEKAHASIFNRFLQLFDEGLLVNSTGEEINLRNTLIIMTSNFGASIVQGEGWGFSVREGMDAVERRVLRATEDFFSPEFINRLDGVTFFKPLSPGDMRNIAARELRKLFERDGLQRRSIQVELDDGVFDVLLKHGYSVRYGARYLKRQIEKMVSYPLAAALLAEPGRDHSLLRLYATREHIKAAWVNEDDEPLPLPSELHRSAPTTIEQAATLVHGMAERLTQLTDTLGLSHARERQSELLEEMSRPGFWDGSSDPQLQLIELGAMARRIDRCDELLRWHAETLDLLERVQGRERRLFPELVRQLMRLERDLRFAELEMLFGDPEDWNDALLLIEQNTAAPGGLHWVRQLATMYTAWAESKDFAVEVLDETAADASQVRITLRINGSGAFGLLRRESGTHRIVEAGAEPGQKQVTPLLVTVLPLATDDMPELPAQDVELLATPQSADGHLLKRLRSSVQALHLSTGQIAHASAASERAARATALLVLHGRLIHSRLGTSLPSDDSPWASVSRSYQFAKRSLIKDPRTKASHSNPREVLNGQLDLFIEAALRELRG